MLRIHTIGLAIVASIAVSAMAVALASAALPEWHFAAATTTKFTGSGGAGLLESTAGNKIKCSSSSSAGTIEKPNLVLKTLVKYNGCKEGTSVLLV